MHSFMQLTPLTSSFSSPQIKFSTRHWGTVADHWSFQRCDCPAPDAVFSIRKPTMCQTGNDGCVNSSHLLETFYFPDMLVRCCSSIQSHYLVVVISVRWCLHLTLHHSVRICRNMARGHMASGLVDVTH